MRLLHPKTLKIVATQMKDSDFDKSTVSRNKLYHMLGVKY